MKRILAFALMVALMFNASFSLAEGSFSKQEGDFAIRNGLRFGMSIEEVCSLEKTYGTSIDGTIESPENESYNPTGYLKMVKYNPVTLMDYSQSTLSFYFDNSEKLMSIGYVFGISSDNPPSYATVFSEMKTLLTNKYDAPYNDNDFVSPNLTTSMFSDDIANYALYNSMGMGSSFYALNQWIVEYDDYYVLIDLYSWNMFANVSHTYLGYRILSPEELTKILEEIESENKVQETKRQNDI